MKENIKQIISEIEKLKKSNIKKIIDLRIKEFEELGRKNSHELFSELCFCILTANFSASGGIKIQNQLKNDFLNSSEKELSKKLKELGHRFPNTRAKYIIQARGYKENLKQILYEIKDEFLTREWIVKNIKGLGMKESSHFLRNIGYKNLAIIDFHIIDLLVKYNLIEKPQNKSLTPKKYIEIENVLKEISKSSNLSLGELDLYLWYKETGKVLK
ncbi:MAG: N-glycosylase/DNA lyase [Candidatus Pacearchaeota archaeon]|jgi:N-glycosylase/DNA lyase